MEKWEHCSVFHRYDSGCSFTPSNAVIELGDTRGLGIMEVANRLGGHGWQLVSVVVISEDFEGIEYYFKRKV